MVNLIWWRLDIVCCRTWCWSIERGFRAGTWILDLGPLSMVWSRR